jgi:hypothetical protein
VFLAASEQAGLPLAQDCSGPRFLYGRHAFGTDAFVGTTVLSGKTAFVTLGDCSTTIGAHVTNTVTSVNVPPLFTTGAINTAATTSASMSQAGSHAQQVSLLSGLITADDITAVSTTTDQNGSLQVSAAGSFFTNLVVAGQQIQATPPPNTKVELPALGYVVVSPRSPSTSDAVRSDLTGICAGSTTLRVRAMPPAFLAAALCL